MAWGEGRCWAVGTSRQRISLGESQAGSCPGPGPSWNYLRRRALIYFLQTSGSSTEIPEASCEHE